MDFNGNHEKAMKYVVFDDFYDTTWSVGRLAKRLGDAPAAPDTQTYANACPQWSLLPRNTPHSQSQDPQRLLSPR